MSKYDFELDLSDSTSTGLILNKIKAGATVLEFGCATGRMTRYMKEVLNCKVYIVEYEQSAFNKAVQYAENGVCDDILTYSWVEAFKEVRFDAILFADVLEHLSNPSEVLIKAKELLKNDGCIYVSIPNVTHNDILLKEMHDHFDYTKVGLLDDTHIHFWGLENIYSLAEECGLNLGKVEATYCPTGSTEQFREKVLEEDSVLLNYFNERMCGEVYQFVITLDHKENQTLQLLKKPIIKSHIYIDSGKGFSQEELIEFEAKYLEPGKYLAHYVIEDCRNIKQLRFDPVELQGCILKYISIRQGGKELDLSYSEYMEYKADIILKGNDPMILVNMQDSVNPIVIDAEILLPGRVYVDEIVNVCFAKQIELEENTRKFTLESEMLREKIADHSRKNEELQGEVVNLNGENERLQGKITDINEEKERIERKVIDLNRENEKLQEKVADLNRENEKWQEEVADLNRENKRLQSEIARLSRENAGLHGDINSYIELVNKKDERLMFYEDLRVVRFREKVLNLYNSIKKR